MARRRRSVLRKTDVSKLTPATINTVRIFQEMTEGLDDLVDRVEQYGAEETGLTLTEQLLQSLMYVIRQPIDSASVDVEARLKAIELADKIRTSAHEMSSKQRMEFAKLATEAQKNQNRLFLEERKLEAQARMAEAQGGFDIAKLAEIAKDA